MLCSNLQVYTYIMVQPCLFAPLQITTYSYVNRTNRDRLLYIS